MSKAKGILRIVARVLEALYIVAMLSFACVAIFSGNKTGTELSSTPITHTTILTVKTDSMKGTFDRNALVIAKIPTKADVLKLKATKYDDDGKLIQKGSIISFPTSIGGKKAINTHRIVAIYGEGDFDTLKFATKGDNSAGIDANLVAAKDVLAIYKGSIPNVGGWIMNMKEGNTFIFVVIVPLAVLFIFNAYIFFKNMSEMKAEKLALEKGAELSDEEKEKLKQEYLKSLEEQNKK